MLTGPKIAILSMAIAIPLTAFVSVNSNAQYIGNDSPLGTPRFNLKDGTNYVVGRAFGIQWFHGKKILICPIHLLGPTAGYPVQIAAKDIPEQVTSVDVLDFKQESTVATAGRGLLRTGQPIEACNGDWSQDMMAFDLLTNKHLPLLPLAPTLVPVGTRVWVLSKDLMATNLEMEKFPGVVAESEPTGVTVNLDRKLTAMGSSGAPIVNAKNELVGMLIGKELGTDRMVIVGIPSTAIYARLWKEVPK